MKCVYKISSVNDDIKEFYIGSTEDFKKRIIHHKHYYNTGCNYKVYTFIRENGGLNTWDIYPIEIIDFPISTDELRQYEQAYLDKYNPELNCKRAFGITPYKDIREKKLKYQHEYCKKNPEKIKAYRKEYYNNPINKQNKLLKDKEYRDKNKDKQKYFNNLKANCPHCNKLLKKNGIKRHIKRKHPTLL